MSNYSDRFVGKFYWVWVRCLEYIYIDELLKKKCFKRLSNVIEVLYSRDRKEGRKLRVCVLKRLCWVCEILSKVSKRFLIVVNLKSLKFK